MSQSNNKQSTTANGIRDSIKAAGLTDIGKVRDHNEDAFFISEDSGLFIVSDDMGGHQGGEVASKIVVDALSFSLSSALKVP
jgi:serine/threonine protein phosphatase PrpC